MKIIVGLGNPGKEYEDTRHNIGFMVIDHLAKDLSDGPVEWVTNKKINATSLSIGGIVLVKPQTFMNASGEAVAKVCSYYKIDPADVWVIHDDLDLPLGKIRIRESGASAGHNGIESIIKAVGTDAFVRFRLGIGHGKEDKEKHTDVHLKHKSVITFVLSRFNQSEAGEMRKLVKRGSDAVRIALIDGVDKAMNRFN
jgi:PTH1 family peptidyl-tRNA hydrolase